MLEIYIEIISIMENDNTLSNLLQATENDSRIYSWNPSADVIYSTSRGAIFYKEAIGKRPSKWSYPKQFSNATLFLKIIGTNNTIVNQIGERLIGLFDLETIETDNWRITTVELLSYNDAVPEGSPTNTQWSKMVTFMFSNIFKRV